MMQDTVEELKQLMNGTPNLMAAVRQIIHDDAELKKQVAEFHKEKVAQLKQMLTDDAKLVGTVNVIRYAGRAEADAAKDIAFQLRQESTNTVVVLGTHSRDGKPLLTVAVTDDLKDRYNASALVKEAARLIQGGGGGQPHFAQAGGKNADGLQAAVDAIIAKLQ